MGANMLNAKITKSSLGLEVTGTKNDFFKTFVALATIVAYQEKDQYTSGQKIALKITRNFNTKHATKLNKSSLNESTIGADDMSMFRANILLPELIVGIKVFEVFKTTYMQKVKSEKKQIQTLEVLKQYQILKNELIKAMYEFDSELLIHYLEFEQEFTYCEKYELDVILLYLDEFVYDCQNKKERMQFLKERVFSRVPSSMYYDILANQIRDRKAQLNATEVTSDRLKQLENDLALDNVHW